MEQFGIATDTAVVALGPMVVVFACEGALGGGLAGDRVGHRFGTFGGQHFAPFLFGFLNFGHDEQLISSWAAQSGGTSA